MFPNNMLVALENFFLASCEEKYERWENISSYHYYINLTLISSLSFLVFEIHTKALSENCVERVRRARKTNTSLNVLYGKQEKIPFIWKFIA